MNNSRKYIILIAYLLAIGLSSVAQQVRPVYPVKPLTQQGRRIKMRCPVKVLTGIFHPILLSAF